MPFTSRDGTCSIHLDDLDWLADLGAGALIRHPNGKLDIACAPDASTSEPSCTWTLNVTASSEDALKKEIDLTCKEMRNAGNEAIDKLREKHPTWEFPKL